MEFQPDKESWDSYTERLEHFFTATGMIDDDKKVFTLIHQNGSSLYTLLKELSFPKNPTQMKYADIMDILKRHYVGSKNIFCARKLFYCAQLKPYESASEWHRRLRSLSIDCDFGDLLEEILVDKFVTGFHGKVLQRLFEMDESLGLQQALEIAQRYETGLTSVDQTKGDKAQQKQPEQQQSEYQSNVPTCSKCGKKGHYTNVCRSQFQAGVSVQDYIMQSRQGEKKQYAQGNVQTCCKCGKRGHSANVCRSKLQASHVEYVFVNPDQVQQQQKQVPTCYKCGKRGHYANVCRSGGQGQRSSSNDEGCKIASHVEYVFVNPDQVQQQQKQVPTCYKCGKRGHYANVCRSGGQGQRSSSNDEGCNIS